MQKNLTLVKIFSAAALGVVVVSTPLMMADDRPDPGKTPAAEVAQPMSLPDGFVAKDLKAEAGIRSGLVKLTERAVTRGDFNNFLAELSSQDKDRAREFKDADQDKLNVVITKIQAEWKAKYGQDFSINDKNLVFNDTFAMVQGEVSDPNVAINNWPVPAQAGQAVTAADRSNAKTEKKEVKNAKMDKGTDVAIVRFPGDAACPQINVSMLHQMLFWRVDVPNDRTGEQIYTDLLSHLTYIESNQDKWPTDVNDAYRLVARHALAAVYGIPAGESHGMN